MFTSVETSWFARNGELNHVIFDPVRSSGIEFTRIENILIASIWNIENIYSLPKHERVDVAQVIPTMKAHRCWE
jgi:hypothetical protein